jgi:hypothetical protein
MKAPTRENFEGFVDAMDVAGSRRTWVHCAANWRVSAFVSLYGELRWGWSRERADAHIASLWQPDEVWSAFIAGVRAEEKLQGR